MKLFVVVPTIRPEKMEHFKKVWSDLFAKHNVILITVLDGEVPELVISGKDQADVDNELSMLIKDNELFDKKYTDIFYRFTDGCRNLGFVLAAKLSTSDDDVVITMDDDIEPLDTIDNYDPIQDHLDTLNKRVPLGWMNTAHLNAPYLRGVPYSIRDEAPVMLSHGVWYGVPDFDGETQLRFEATLVEKPYTSVGPLCSGGIPNTLPYYVGPIPKGVLFPLCGMNVAVNIRALPYLYFAPMGPDTGIEGLNRFADIWMGIFLKESFDTLGWACYTGSSTILHKRASDARKNFEQEKLGRVWTEWESGKELTHTPEGYDVYCEYMAKYSKQRQMFKELIESHIKRD